MAVCAFLFRSFAGFVAVQKRLSVMMSWCKTYKESMQLFVLYVSFVDLMAKGQPWGASNVAKLSRK